MLVLACVEPQGVVLMEQWVVCVRFEEAGHEWDSVDHLLGEPGLGSWVTWRLADAGRSLGRLIKFHIISSFLSPRCMHSAMPTQVGGLWKAHVKVRVLLLGAPAAGNSLPVFSSRREETEFSREAQPGSASSVFG